MIRTLGLIKPDAFCKFGYILDDIWKSGLRITNMKSFRLTREQASDFYDELKFSGNFKYFNRAFALVKMELSKLRFVEIVLACLVLLYQYYQNSLIYYLTLVTH